MSPDPLAVTQAQLDAARDRLRRVRMGPALRASNADLDALATVGEADLVTAEMVWNKHVPSAARGLLDAKRYEDQGT